MTVGLVVLIIALLVNNISNKRRCPEFWFQGVSVYVLEGLVFLRLMPNLVARL